ncbi:glycosyltransferase family 2 protein [Desulfuromonas sp. TF]|uniref:glycosyltransferase family 2 protein n=1 Tax=Desulfuromonas sp. TF TaxID=1232410 RepID=UPI00040ED782|nr:glycosyltransferase family 2 protein [Desulfuromonas sp. TF]
MSTYILLLNWNGWKDTIECLESIFRNVPAETRVIVCDNESTDGSLERIQAWANGNMNVLVPVEHHFKALSWPPIPKPIRYRIYERDEAERGGDSYDEAKLVLIRTGGNLGFAGGNNVGLRYFLSREDSDYIWLLNNDTVIAPGALDALLIRMSERPDAGICGSTLLRYDVPEQVQARGGGWYCKWIGLPWHLGQLGRAGDRVDVGRIERRMNYVVGASLFVSRSMLEKVGLMCEDYFLFFEDTDWSLRIRGRFALAYAIESRVYHKVGRSIGTSSLPSRKSYICDYYNMRNRLLFTRRYFPAVLPSIYFSLMIAMLIRALCCKWERVRLIWQIITGQKVNPCHPVR